MFDFGENWQNFSKNTNPVRIKNAENSLKQKLNLGNMSGLTFLDIGCGSGIFSLAAYNLGATVTSIDINKKCIECTKILKEKYSNKNQNWVIKQADFTNSEVVKLITPHDIIYCWGVLHHTGKMWECFEKLFSLAKNDSLLYIAIYNDQGFISNIWKKIKIAYNSNTFSKYTIIFTLLPIQAILLIAKGSLKHFSPFYYIKDSNNPRGMNFYYDFIDWVGGFPFEVATPKEVLLFSKKNMFEITNQYLTNGSGCNEYILKKIMRN
ncbi:class I SAM-dependent methyltransferase [Zooshikella sp. RANM57]|uniref:class I SAM-dependent methyltransferase n=1 Tax=Zooshikella sp. RANM57 TaxID=3425863 RepID=UPI003D6E960A